MTCRPPQRRNLFCLTKSCFTLNRTSNFRWEMSSALAWLMWLHLWPNLLRHVEGDDPVGEDDLLPLIAAATVNALVILLTSVFMQGGDGWKIDLRSPECEEELKGERQAREIQGSQTKGNTFFQRLEQASFYHSCQYREHHHDKSHSCDIFHYSHQSCFHQPQFTLPRFTCPFDPN